MEAILGSFGGKGFILNGEIRVYVVSTHASLSVYRSSIAILLGAGK
jgi:hypothetical protein